MVSHCFWMVFSDNARRWNHWASRTRVRMPTMRGEWRLGGRESPSEQGTQLINPRRRFSRMSMWRRDAAKCCAVTRDQHVVRRLGETSHLSLAREKKVFAPSDIKTPHVRPSLRWTCSPARVTIGTSGPKHPARYWQASHSRSFDHRFSVLAPLIAIASAFRCPTRTTRRLPRVTPV
jgi:hypothetical protein